MDCFMRKINVIIGFKRSKTLGIKPSYHTWAEYYDHFLHMNVGKNFVFMGHFLNFEA